MLQCCNVIPEFTVIKMQPVVDYSHCDEILLYILSNTDVIYHHQFAPMPPKARF